MAYYRSCAFACVYIDIHTYIYIHLHTLCVNMCIYIQIILLCKCIHLYIYIYMCTTRLYTACTCVEIYIYVYLFIYVCKLLSHQHRSPPTLDVDSRVSTDESGLASVHAYALRGAVGPVGRCAHLRLAPMQNTRAMRFNPSWPQEPLTSQK